MGDHSPIVPFVRTSKPLTSSTSSGEPADCSDRESQRVLAEAARAVAYEWGREYARECFDELIGKPGEPKIK